MAGIKKLELTKDPLTNIKMMIPLLDDRAREAVSYLMFGYCIRESMEKDGQRDKQSQKAG